MGWDFYSPTHYLSNRRVDRKRECDDLFKYRDGTGTAVVASRLVGSTYYGAIEADKNAEDKKVVGVVILTKEKEGLFGYKLMDETMGPYYYGCPGAILKKLTPTDNERANIWREKCKLYESKLAELKGLPKGAVVTVNMDGKTYNFEKATWRGKTAYIDRYYWTKIREQELVTIDDMKITLPEDREDD